MHQNFCFFEKSAYILMPCPKIFFSVKILYFPMHIDFNINTRLKCQSALTFKPSRSTLIPPQNEILMPDLKVDTLWHYAWHCNISCSNRFSSDFKPFWLWNNIVYFSNDSYDKKWFLLWSNNNLNWNMYIQYSKLDHCATSCFYLTWGI